MKPTKGDLTNDQDQFTEGRVGYQEIRRLARDATLSRIRTLIKQADPEAVEERKWVKPGNPEGVPTWYHDGIICTGETYKTHVKLTFAKGASLKDASRLFNSSLEGHVRRAIDFREGEKIDEKAFKALIQEAVALNEMAVRRK